MMMMLIYLLIKSFIFNLKKGLHEVFWIVSKIPTVDSYKTRDLIVHEGQMHKLSSCKFILFFIIIGYLFS